MPYSLRSSYDAQASAKAQSAAGYETTVTKTVENGTKEEIKANISGLKITAGTDGKYTAEYTTEVKSATKAPKKSKTKIVAEPKPTDISVGVTKTDLDTGAVEVVDYTYVSGETDKAVATTNKGNQYSLAKSGSTFDAVGSKYAESSKILPEGITKTVDGDAADLEKSYLDTATAFGDVAKNPEKLNASYANQWTCMILEGECQLYK